MNMFRIAMMPQSYRLPSLLLAVAFFGSMIVVGTINESAPANASTGNGSSATAAVSNALARAARLCAATGRGYRITSSTIVYGVTSQRGAATPGEAIYVDANCDAAGKRAVRLLSDVHSGYVWNDRDGALHYIK